MKNLSELHIDLRQMIIAIETAVSLVGMNDTNHGKRVGYIASQLGHQMGFNDQDIQFLFELGLLHDCGVSTEQMHSDLVNHFDWDGAHLHCEIGHRLLTNFSPLSKFANPILYHHTPWKQLKDIDTSTYDKGMANIIFLADRIDALSAGHYESDILLEKNKIVPSITQHAGSYFAPLYIDAFCALEKSEAFWIALEDRHITRYTWDMGQIESDHLLSLQQLKQLSLIMSYVVDQKSPFTAQHSIRVANLAKYLASRLNLTTEQCQKVEIAGLLHDLGKLHTPDYILEKAGPLSDIERSVMNRHSYETFEILRHIKGLGEISLWAAFHHEGINGAGYPFHPSKQDLSTEARILSIADIFQALVQDRPYRCGMVLQAVLNILDDMVNNGKLDSDIVNLVHQNAHDCFEIARGNNQSDSLHTIDLLSSATVIN